LDRVWGLGMQIPNNKTQIPNKFKGSNNQIPNNKYQISNNSQNKNFSNGSKRKGRTFFAWVQSRKNRSKESYSNTARTKR
jgi:hypothetical protein